jgi:broad specificity phosphatase PhoE
LVRHGRAAAGWDEDPDPGLDEVGRAQASAVADLLADVPVGRAPAVAPAPPAELVTSPLRRARETAEPLAERWGVVPTVDPAVGEVPSPTDDLAERGAWLEGFLRSRWSEQPAPLVAWRDAVVAWCRDRPHDTVVATHFVVVNAVLGAATGDDRVVCRMVANGAVVTLDVEPGGALRLVDTGPEAATTVL